MNRLEEATRPIMWNVPFSELMYLLFFVSLAIMVFGLLQRISVWRKGTAAPDRLDNLLPRLLNMLVEILTQRKVRHSFMPGVFHSLFFYSFIVFVFTTGIIALDYDFGTQLFNGYLYITLSLLSDFAGLLFLVGLVMASWRRLITKPLNLNSDRTDAVALGLLTLIVLTGFLLEGLRIALTNDPWKALSPVGYLVGTLFQNLEQPSGLTLHASIWWVHTVSVMAWIALIPYTKFFHLITLPTNAFFIKRKPAGELNRINLEAVMADEDFDADNFSIGLGTTRDFTWKQRLNLDACVSCGRCDDACPAVAAGLSLSPKQFILGMKKTLYQTVGKPPSENENTSYPTEIVGNAFDETFFWHCRTCRACDSVCPAYIDHVDTQIDIRRSEVNMQGRMPEDAEKMLRTMETLGNPLGHQSERIRWAESLDVPLIGSGDSCEVLYWVGCLTTFDPEKRQIALDMINILQQTETDFGLLGEGEFCCGDPARICGEENLFQMTASQQVEELKKRKFKILLVSCPHCLTVLKDEFPQFGGSFEVIHHTEFLQRNHRYSGPSISQLRNRTAVLHDPCYLGRYQDVYQAPRQMLKSIPRFKTVEMNNSGRDSFCCGAGGGHFWMDIKQGERINVLRINQSLETGADTIVTACPFCHHMIDDALKLRNLEDKMQVRDIVSLLVEPNEEDENQ